MTGEAIEHIVDLDRNEIVARKVIPNREAPYGQPSVMLEEFFKCEAVVKADPGWRKAMLRRGLTDKDIELVQVDPFSSGFFDFEYRARRAHRAGRQLLPRAICQDNGYAHPIEGVVAVVDLIGGKVIDLTDADPIVPIPRKKRNYGAHEVTNPRTDIKPLHSNSRKARASRSTAGRSTGRNGVFASASRRARGWCCISSATRTASASAR